jgi:hypothetical protein
MQELEQRMEQLPKERKVFNFLLIDFFANFANFASLR